VSTSLTELETKNEVAIVDVSDALTNYADAFAPQFIIGEMLRFSKGDWLVGDDIVAIATTFTVAVDELMAGWIKWLDSKPVEHLMVRVIDGIPPKSRGQLGDHDTAQWEMDATGKEKKDPWQFTNYLPMMNDKGELYTFTTSSRGGIGAIAKLVRQYAKHRKRHPDVFPLVALNVDSYQHKKRELGRIKFPVFDPAGYVPKTDFLAALATAGYAADVSDMVPEEPEADPEDELNDQCPF
jgi:hypothetical protein